MTHWLVVGGGVTAREYIKIVQPEKVIGSNRCLEFCTPDTYWITDPMAIERYRHLWSRYEGEIITNADLGRPTTRWPYMNAGALYGRSCSGLLACRVALERGASKVTLIGFEGHRPEDYVRDINDQPMWQYGEHAARRNKDMEQVFQAMGEQYPKVSFVHLGPTCIVLPTLPNWSHTE